MIMFASTVIYYLDDPCSLGGGRRAVNEPGGDLPATEHGRRGGVKRNSGLIYEETRSVLAKRKTVSAIVLYTRSSATAVP